MVSESKPTVTKIRPSSNQDGGSRVKLESSDNKRKIIDSSIRNSIPSSKHKSVSLLTKSEVPILETWVFLTFGFRFICRILGILSAMFWNASNFSIGESNGFRVIEIWSLWACFSYFPCFDFVFYWFFFFFLKFGLASLGCVILGYFISVLLIVNWVLVVLCLEGKVKDNFEFIKDTNKNYYYYYNC